MRLTLPASLAVMRRAHLELIAPMQDSPDCFLTLTVAGGRHA